MEYQVFQHLAGRVKASDAAAAAELQQELEPQVLRLVRSALRAGAGDSPLTQWIQREARYCLGRSWGTFAAEEERRVARRLCACVTHQLRTEPTFLRTTPHVMCN
jgi:hypothetical protein